MEKQKNQIDFVIVKKENLSFVKNCCVYNSADFGSDHSLLLSKFLLPIPKKRQSRTTLKRFDVDKLENQDYKEDFRVKIGGRFAPLLNFNGDIDELYDKFKEITNSVTNEVVGPRKRKFVDNMSRETVDLCRQRRKSRLVLSIRKMTGSLLRTSVQFHCCRYLEKSFYGSCWEGCKQISVLSFERVNLDLEKVEGL